MIPHVHRSGDASIRVLEARVRGAELDIMDLQLAAWAAGLAGRRPPPLPDPTEDLHVRQAAAFGARDDEAGFAILAEHISTDAGNKLLIHACHLVGDRCADTLLEHAAQHPDVWFSGPMLVRTRQPLRLLALADASGIQTHIVNTIGELAIRGRDTGSTVREVEERWAELNRPSVDPGYLSGFRNAQLRIAAREDMEYAIEWTQEHARGWGYDAQDDGTEAVLGRLVRVDPERACRIVAGREDPENRLSWLWPLVRWFELPVAAESIVDELFAHEPPVDPIALAQTLIMAHSWDRLDRALAQIEPTQLPELATSVAVAIARLRDAGLHDDAEIARARVLMTLGARATEGVVSPRDLLDVLSAPGRPPLVPWKPDPGLP
jgi:hypothetical protein